MFLDETTRGLTGNLALVADGRALGELGRVPEILARLGALARAHLPEGYGTPVTLRFRLHDGDTPAPEADTECRFKLRIPEAALRAGRAAVSALAAATVRAFEDLTRDARLYEFLPEPVDGAG